MFVDNVDREKKGGYNLIINAEKVRLNVNNGENHERKDQFR